MDLNKFDEPFSPEDIEWRITILALAGISFI